MHHDITGYPVWGEGVRVLRGIRGMTQEQLAEAAGVKQNTVSRIETGATRATDETRVRIATALQVDPHLLFPYVTDQAS